jgi:NAD(P)-dependent dehydrogenase (short-subunit alcohol dehydrogenase family)
MPPDAANRNDLSMVDGTAASPRLQRPMSDQMVAAGQGDALKAMEKSTPMGRVDANAVLWLCGDAASYVTGQSIAVDGGFIMR